MYMNILYIGANLYRSKGIYIYILYKHYICIYIYSFLLLFSPYSVLSHRLLESELSHRPVEPIQTSGQHTFIVPLKILLAREYNS